MRPELPCSVFLTDLWNHLDRPHTSFDSDDLYDEIDFFQRRDSSKTADEDGYLAGLKNVCFNLALGPHAAEGIKQGKKWLEAADPTGPSHLTVGTAQTLTRLKWRVYINVVPAYAPAIFATICSEVDLGNTVCQLGSYGVALRRRDVIVCRLENPEERDRLLAVVTGLQKAHPYAFGSCTVPFTVPVTTAIGFVAQSPAESGLESLVHTWALTEEGQSLATRHYYFDPDLALMSTPQMICVLLADSWRKAGSEQQYNFVVNDAIFRDLGLDLTTGEIRPRAAMIARTIDYFYVCRRPAHYDPVINR
jgi:hypothetical protein